MQYAVSFTIMSAQKTISIRMPVEAVEHYLRLNEYHIKLIKKGLRAAERGDFVPDAEMKKLIARMRRAK